MRKVRLAFLVLSLLISAALAIAARDLAYSLIVVPLAFITWELGIIYRAVPQLVWWVALIVITVLVIAWQLVPEFRWARTATHRGVPAVGQVYAVAQWVRRARTSTYFKWQLAHRLGRVWRRNDELMGNASETDRASGAVGAFLAAGLRNSFMDYPSRRGFLGNSRPTPLDADLSDVLMFLEAQLPTEQGDHAEPV